MNKRIDRRFRLRDEFNYSDFVLCDPDTYADLEEEEYKKHPEEYGDVLDIEEYVNDVCESDLDVLYDKISDNPAKITGIIGRWNGNKQIYPDYHSTMKKALDKVIFTSYDKQFELKATPDYKHFLYTESNHDQVEQNFTLMKSLMKSTKKIDN